jgi:hypothetical protein
VGYVANYTIFYRCSDNAGPYYTNGTNYSGVYYYWNDGHYYRVDHYSDSPEGNLLSEWGLDYYGSECPSGYTIFYRCGDNAGPYYVYNTNYSGVYYYWGDARYYRVDHYSDSPEGNLLIEDFLSYYGSACPPGLYTIFYRCGDNAGPYYAGGTNYSGVYSYTDGRYYRVDHYSWEPEGSRLNSWQLSYYGPACPGGPSFNPAWALYTNSYVGIGHV